MELKFAAIAALSALLLAGCGETRAQRVATGTVGGLVAGEVLADEPLAGAAVGGIGGALR